VLAMATTPRMDLNEFWRYAEVFPKDTPFNRAISQSYEPGSVFKVLTMASALDAGAVTRDTVFVDTGAIEYGGTWIYNWNMGRLGAANDDRLPAAFIECLPDMGCYATRE
jgi:cell division protein FtsI/penicillin-binding protein 2